MRISAPALWLAVLAAVAGQGARAQVILNETFTDGNLAVGSDANDGQWVRQNGATQTIGIVSDGVIGGGNAISYTNLVNGTLFVGSMQSAAVLGSNVGDRIDGSFDFRFTQLPSAASASFFRYGIFTHGGSAPTDGGTETNPDGGYISDFGAGGSSGLVSWGLESGGSDGLGGGTGASALASSTQVRPVDINDTAKHHVLFQITRSAAGISLAEFVDGQLACTAVDTASPFTSFNELAFRLTGGPATVDYDNLIVQTAATPEPGCIGVIGLGAFAAAPRRRKRTTFGR